MRKILLALCLPLVLLAACKQSREGTIDLENGEGKNIAVEYKISKPDYDKIISKFTEDDLKKMAKSASSKAKNSCEHTLTYDPKEIHFMFDGEKLVVTIDFNAKNAIGVSDALMSYSYFKDGKQID